MIYEHLTAQPGLKQKIQFYYVSIKSYTYFRYMYRKIVREKEGFSLKRSSTKIMNNRQTKSYIGCCIQLIYCISKLMFLLNILKNINVNITSINYVPNVRNTVKS